MKSTIYIASDHAGFEHKTVVKDWLEAEDFSVIDFGAHTYDVEDDFPTFIAPLAGQLQATTGAVRGIIFGGSGQGEAMVANRFPGVRATVYYGGEPEIITLSRSHNNANVLSIGARFVDIDTAKAVIWDWLHAPGPTQEKYHRRNRTLATLAAPTKKAVRSWNKLVAVLQREI